MSRLQLRQLSCGYGTRTVLRDVTLDVSPGSIVAIAGANGAGKTTLLKTAARLLPPQAGELLLDGVAVARMPARAYARAVAYAPQHVHVELPLTVREYVALGRAPHRGWIRALGAADRRVVDGVLEALDVAVDAQRPLHELSGGQQRRAVLARALAQEPRVLVLDEPTVFLDLKHELDLLRVLRGLRDRGMAVLLTIHDLTRAAEWADHVALLADQRVLAAGVPGAVLTPAAIARAYGVDVAIVPHPISGAPIVVPREA